MKYSLDFPPEFFIKKLYNDRLAWQIYFAATTYRNLYLYRKALITLLLNISLNSLNRYSHFTICLDTFLTIERH